MNTANDDASPLAGALPGEDSLPLLAAEIHSCRRCPRLAEYLDESRRRFPEYWSRPVAGFGDPEARLLLLGLAPALHGANRHGRVFTGDQSGAWLWRALYELGLASAPESLGGEQPLAAFGVYVSAAVRCAPPGNRPTPAEFAACRDHLRRELQLLPRVRVVAALGRLAHESLLRLHGVRPAAHPFRHGAVHHPVGCPYVLVDSYHPSRQNTNTRVLTWEMWLGALGKARELAGLPAARGGEGIPPG